MTTSHSFLLAYLVTKAIAVEVAINQQELNEYQTTYLMMKSSFIVDALSQPMNFIMIE